MAISNTINTLHSTQLSAISKFSIGDQIEIPVGNEVFTATAVKEEDDDGMLFIFNTIVGNSTMTMQSFLNKFYKKLPETLRKRMRGNNLRLLDASEVFYRNVPDQWEWLISHSDVKVENPPIPYFARDDFRNCGADWRLRSIASPSPLRFAIVANYGGVYHRKASFSTGVRPAFTIY